MTLNGSSICIDYLGGRETAVEYIKAHFDERAVAPPRMLFEVYQGEVFKADPPDLAAVDGALEWRTVVETTSEQARAAAALQAILHQQGTSLAALR